MARLVDGIKEMLKGKDDSDHEYRHRSGYDQRHGSESDVRYYGHQRPYGESVEGYRNGYDRSEYRRGGYGSSEVSPRGEYRIRKSSRYGSKREDDGSEVIELMVPMCCDKCQEKVEEELSEVEGVESVYCDQNNDRVTVTGSEIDTDRCLVKAERAVKKKCELISRDSDDEEDGSRRGGGHGGYYVVREHEGRGSGRKSFGRLPSFASGRTVFYDGVDPRGIQDYEEKDFNGFRRMPSFSKHRHHEAEYITSFHQRPEPLDPRRDYYSARRMPSFNRHRFHDAEYINTGDLEYSPRTFYDRNAGSTYTTAYNERPVYRSQVSFSRLPVGNPSYVKHMDY